MTARRVPPAAEAFEQRAREFLLTHRKILSDFERSLKNARHFIKLAGKSMEREPESTLQMIEQIREIDLLRHVTHQLDEYESVIAMLSPVLTTGSATEKLEGPIADFKAMRERYEALVAEAESQAAEMEKIAAALTSPH